MTFKLPPNAVCPHCGFESDDEELCRVCGKLTYGDLPVRNVSLARTLGTFFARMQGKGFHGVGVDDVLNKDPWSDPGWSTLTGNLLNHDKD